jgi:glycosyltransferase involved in cell wall biosynthesis
MTAARPVRIGIAAHLLSFAGSYRQAGVSRYVAELLRAFAVAGGTDGTREYVAFVGPERVPSDFLPPAADGSSRFVHSRLPTARPPVRIAWEQVAGPVAALRERLDLIHGPVNALPLGAPCPGVITIHDLTFLARPEAHNPGRRRYLSLMTKLAARRAARIIAVSAFTRDEIVRLLGIPAGKIAVVPNGVDAAFAPLPPGEVARFRAERGLPEQYILCVGTLEPRKNLTGLLDAFARLAPQIAAELVVVGGQGWRYDQALARVDALGLQGRVRFAGHVPDDELPRWYNAAAVFVYPSLYEGFGLPALEALACGVPTVTSAGTAMAEVTGDAALLADPRDPAALAAAIGQALGDDNLRVRLRERGPLRAAAFNWARTAAGTHAVYDDVLACRRGKRHAERQI